MPREVTIGVVQCALSGSLDANVARVEALVREAAAKGAQRRAAARALRGPVLLPGRARGVSSTGRSPSTEHPTIARFSRAREGARRRHSRLVLRARGPRLLQQRRDDRRRRLRCSASIARATSPTDPGYEEKYYFRPGDTGFRVVRHALRHGRRRHLLGPVVSRSARARWRCSAPRCCSTRPRSAASPSRPDVDTKDPWQRAMIGHAVSNAMPVAAANRVGTEGGQRFYGSSFVAERPRRQDRGARSRRGGRRARDRRSRRGRARYRATWGFFRDRRPDLYGVLGTADGKTRVTSK